METLVLCAHCGVIIGQASYATDGTYVFHADCQKTVRREQFHADDVNPSGNDFRPVAMNLTRCTGIEITMVSLTDPSHCSGLNVMSMKLPL